jgi:hypothetical protein
MDAEGKRATLAIVKEQGRARDRVPEMRAKIVERRDAAKSRMDDESLPEAKRESAKRSHTKSSRSLEALDTVAPDLKNANVTLGSATRRRIDLVNDAREQIRTNPVVANSPSPLTASGGAWYFSHRGDINKIADTHGVEQSVAVVAAGVMSPNNSPENEKDAAAAYIRAHVENPEVALPRGSARSLGVAAGTHRFNDLPASAAARLSNSRVRGGVSGLSGETLTSMGNSGTDTNAETALTVLRTGASLEDSVDPHSSPKVHSYVRNTLNARPGSPEHNEYLRRLDALMHPVRGQLSMDTFGLKDSTEGILSPTSVTAEDTWQKAISSGQPYRSSGGGRTSPAKFVASDKVFTEGGKTTVVNGERISISGDARIGLEAGVHAFNNQASIQAAAHFSSETGEIIPPTMVQEIGWTVARRMAGKDPEYNAKVGQEAAQERSSKAGPRIKGQQKLF